MEQISHKDIGDYLGFIAIQSIDSYHVSEKFLSGSQWHLAILYKLKYQFPSLSHTSPYQCAQPSTLNSACFPFLFPTPVDYSWVFPTPFLAFGRISGTRRRIHPSTATFLMRTMAIFVLWKTITKLSGKNNTTFSRYNFIHSNSNHSKDFFSHNLCYLCHMVYLVSITYFLFIFSIFLTILRNHQLMRIYPSKLIIDSESWLIMSKEFA